MSYYENIVPLQTAIRAARQSAKRHYGVHPYFTRRPYNVVQKYILHYSRERDVVLDPFGGSGVTAIEAFLENRVGVQNDINPFANFIARGIVDLAKGHISAYTDALESLKHACESRLRQLQVDDGKLGAAHRTVHLPPNISLPSDSDVRMYYDLFSPRQLVSLALLKDAIDALSDRYAGRAMLLAWSATLTKLNRTFLSAEGRAESRGGSSIFSIYRYKVAKKPVELPAWETFHERALNIIAAKREIDKAVEYRRRRGEWCGRFETHNWDVDELSRKFDDSVDYIFTDPPYGGHIAYLDLSVLWNHWLGHTPGVAQRQKELIVGGELDISEAAYTERLAGSVQACVKMLKRGRWLSIVFQHWNTSYFEAILCSAAEGGADLKAAISQVGDPIWSMHKKKRDQSVLAGEMILTFYKTGKPKRIRRDAEFDVSRSVGEILANANGGRVYGEYLFNQVIIEAWNRSAIGSLRISKIDFINVIKKHGWHYDETNYCWVRNPIPEGTLFAAVRSQSGDDTP